MDVSGHISMWLNVIGEMIWGETSNENHMPLATGPRGEVNEPGYERMAEWRRFKRIAPEPARIRS